MTDSQHKYAKFEASRKRLIELLQQGRTAFSEVNMDSWADAAEELIQRLASERFKVIVLGEFKRGKSTFINSLLGSEVLPAFATPCTAVINELKWGEEPRALLHFKNPPPVQLPEGLAVEAVRHMEKHRGDVVPSLEVSVEDLERYVVIPDPSKDQSASVAETPYEYAEIWWPLELLRNSVEIIDSPGLNEHGSRTKVTMEYLGKIDAVIFVLSVHALASQTEIGVVDRELRGSGHEYLFFVCNRFDELRRAQDRDRITQYAYEHLAPRTALGREGVFFVSALDAVIGREEQDSQLVEKSKIPVVERALAEFLVNHRGRVKLLQPANQLLRGLKAALYETIPDRRKMLDANIAELESRVRSALPRLEEANRRKRASVELLERCRIRMRDAVRDAAANHLRSLADQAPQWASEVNLDSKINVFKVWAVEKQVQAVAEEVVRGVGPMMEDATARWQEQRLRPLVADQLADFSTEAEATVSEFLVDMDGIRNELSGDTSAAHLPEAKVGATERVLASVGGLILGGAGSAIEGAAMGYQGMLRSLVPQILVAVGAIVVLHLNPITVIPALIATGLFRTFRQGDALTAKAKVEVGRGMASNIIDKIPEQSQAIAAAIYDQTEGLVASISAGMDREIDTIRKQVDSVMEVKRAGAEQVAAERSHIADVEHRLQGLDSAAQQFVVDIVE